MVVLWTDDGGAVHVMEGSGPSPPPSKEQVLTYHCLSVNDATERQIPFCERTLQDPTTIWTPPGLMDIPFARVVSLVASCMQSRRDPLFASQL